MRLGCGDEERDVPVALVVEALAVEALAAEALVVEAVPPQALVAEVAGRP